MKWLSRRFLLVPQSYRFLNESIDICASGGIGFLKEAPRFEVMDSDQPFPVKLDISFPGQKHEIMPGLKRNAIAGPILAFSIQAPHSFWERSRKPVSQMRIPLDKLSIPMQQMPTIFRTLRVGEDKRRIFLAARMMEDGKKVPV